MSIPYRTQRVLKRISVIVLAAVVILGAVWACWMLWVQRYIVYTPDEGAKLDFSLPPMQSGEVAVEPEELEISIYLNPRNPLYKPLSAFSKHPFYLFSSFFHFM